MDLKEFAKLAASSAWKAEHVVSGLLGRFRKINGLPEDAAKKLALRTGKSMRRMGQLDSRFNTHTAQRDRIAAMKKHFGNQANFERMGKRTAELNGEKL